MPPTEVLAKKSFRLTGQGGMLSNFGILLFQALERGNAVLFLVLSFGAVEEGEMLSVFQILFSGRPQGWGECCPFFSRYFLLWEA